MKKIFKLFSATIIILVLLSQVCFANNGYNINSIDNYVGQKIINLKYYHSSGGYYPYQKRLDSKGNLQCVGYAYARLEEKLGLSPNFRSGEGAKDIPGNAPDGETRTAINGTVYTIEVYKNDGGSNITSNCWVSFGAGSSQYGHVIYVEEVIGDNVYYTESGTNMWKKGTTGTLRKKSKYDFINKCSSGGKYVGTVVFKPKTSTKPPIDNSSTDVVVKKTKPTIDVTQYPTTITQGKSFGLRGTISSENNVTSVKGYIINSSGSTVMSTSDSPNAKSNNIRYLNLNQDMLFNKLSAGNYTLKIVAKDSSSGDSSSWEKSFAVKPESSSTSNNSSYSSSSNNSGQTIADGVYVIATKLNTNYVLDISDASKDNGANLQLWKNNGTAAQTFKITHVGNGYYQIVNTNSGKAIDVQNGDTAAGTNVWQYQINNTDAQLWKITNAGNGSYYIIGKGSGLYLDVDNADAYYGTNVKIFDKNDAYDAQKWIFIKTSSSSSSSSSPTSSSSSSQTTSSSTSIKFELESVPKGTLPYGKSFSLKGWFRSDSAIVEARAYMLDANKNIVMQSDKASSTTNNYKIQGYKLDKAMKFNELSPGGYYLKYYVKDANGDSATWISDMFYIVK